MGMGGGGKGGPSENPPPPPPQTLTSMARKTFPSMDICLSGFTGCAAMSAGGAGRAAALAGKGIQARQVAAAINIFPESYAGTQQANRAEQHSTTSTAHLQTTQLYVPPAPQNPVPCARLSIFCQKMPNQPSRLSMLDALQEIIAALPAEALQRAAEKRLHTLSGFGHGRGRRRAHANALLLLPSRCRAGGGPAFRLVKLDLPPEGHPEPVNDCLRALTMHPIQLAASAFRLLVEACPEEARPALLELGAERLLVNLWAHSWSTAGVDVAEEKAAIAAALPGAAAPFYPEVFFLGDRRFFKDDDPPAPAAPDSTIVGVLRALGGAGAFVECQGRVERAPAMGPVLLMLTVIEDHEDDEYIVPLPLPPSAVRHLHLAFPLRVAVV